MKKRLKSGLLMSAFAFVVITVITTGAEGLGSRAAAAKGCGPDSCLDVWDPVICADGRIYSNRCYARRACAKGCVAY